MKRLILIGLATFATLSAQMPAPWPKPVPVPGCHAKGVTMQTYYGTHDDILRGVRRGTNELSDFRMHLVLVESKKGAEAFLYERAENGWAVKSWTGATIGDVRAQLDAMVLRTRGSACAGDEMKAMLVNHGIGLRPRGTSTDQTLQAVLTTVLARYPTGYLRVTALDPCETPKSTSTLAQR